MDHPKSVQMDPCEGLANVQRFKREGAREGLDVLSIMPLPIHLACSPLSQCKRENAKNQKNKK